jgi:hypothetical protein
MNPRPDTEYKICEDKTLPGFSPYDRGDPSNLSSRRWETGTKLRIRFLEGEPEIKDKVESYAKEWTKYANLKFSFVSNGNSEIRIAFQKGSSWSYIGRDALEIADNKATMNFGWLTKDTAAREYSRIVLHEFGHALGLIHEHRNPFGEFPWDRETVYRVLSEPPFNWDNETVNHNLFDRYNHNISNEQEESDERNDYPESVMLFPIPGEFALNRIEVGYNYTTLSETDKKLIKTLYPDNS